MPLDDLNLVVVDLNILRLLWFQVHCDNIREIFQFVVISSFKIVISKMTKLLYHHNEKSVTHNSNFEKHNDLASIEKLQTWSVNILKKKFKKF